MKKTPTTLTIFVLVISYSLIFVSCQKEQTLKANEKAEVLGASSARMATGQNTNDADKAFDKAVQQIMKDMMAEMKKMEMTCDPDIDFAAMMIMHHDAGIKMADAELQYGHEAEGKELAQKTKDGNEESKERLLAFLASHPTPEPLSKEQCKLFMKEMDETMKMMMMCMKKTSDTHDVDVDFANQMICHHQGAIDMSKVELKWGNDQAALAEAQTIINEQSEEIIELSQFVNEHGMPAK